MTSPRRTDGLKLWQRIVLIALIGTVPLFVVSTILVRSSASASLRFAELERRGVALQRPLADLLELLPRYRIIANRARIDSRMADTLAAVRAQIDNALLSLDTSFAGDIRKVLHFTDEELIARGRGQARLSTLRAHWDTARTEVVDPSKGTGALDRTIESAQAMIRHAGDQSHLVLDGELDSYYLVAITTTLLPKSQVRVSQALTQIAALQEKGQTAELRREAAKLSALIRLDLLDPILRNARTSLAEDSVTYGASKSLQANLPPAVEAFRASSMAFCDLLDRVDRGESVDITLIEHTGRRALADGDKLWNVATAELGELLRIRVAAIQRERMEHFSVVVLTLLFALGVIGWIIRGLLASRFREIAETEQQLRTIGDNQPNAMVYEVLEDGAGGWHFQYISAGVERLHGVSVDDAMRDAMLVFGQLLPDDRQLLAAGREEAIRTNGHLEMRGRIRRADGEVRWMHFSSAPRLREDGQRVWDGIETDVTDRANAEEFESRLAAIVESTDDAIFSQDLQSIVMTWNPGAEALYGYTAAEIVGTSILRTIPGNRAHEEEYILASARRRESVKLFETIRLRKDGTEIDVSMTASPIMDEAGTVIGVSKVARDMTERRRTQEALRKSEELFRTSFENATTGVCLVSLDGRYLTVNRTLCTWFGYSREELEGRSVHDVTLPEDRAIGMDLIAAAARGDAPQGRIEKRYLRKDGSIMWADISTVLMSADENQPPYFISHVQDITERKASELRIQHLNRMYMVLSGINEMIVREKDPDTIISRACSIAVDRGKLRMAWVGMLNGSAHRLTPVASAGAVDGFLDDLQLDLEDPDARATCNDIENDTGAVSWRTEALRRGYRSASTLPLRISGKTIGAITLYASEANYFDDAELVLLDELAADISFALEVQQREHERRQAEQSLRESEARYRQVEDQFRQSQKMEAIGQLAGGVAHDFNNILAAIMFEAEFANADDVPPDTKDRLNNILSFSERAANLTQQLLLFSRRQVMQLRDVDLNNSVANLSKMLRRIIGEDVELQLHLQSASLTARADSGMLDQVLMNLAVNARDAMPGGGQLRIETAECNVSEDTPERPPDAAPGRYSVITVSDTGSGIPADVLPRIFEPFFTTKEPGKGTGLGLATVFGIVRQHHGWINVHSELGTGTRFEVYLPAAQAKSETSGVAAHAARARGGDETILLVEDESSLRRLSRDILTRAGYKVLEASNGVEALDKFAADDGSVQLVVTDMVMPGGLGGLEMAARMVQRRPDVRVIFTSGYNPDFAGQELALQDGQNFLQKPYSTRVLLDTIRRCLDS